MVFHWSLNTKEETCCCSFSSEESLLNCQFTSGWLLKDEEDDVVLKWKRLCDCDLWHTKSGTIWTVYYKEKNDLGRLEKSLCVSALYIWLPIMCLVRMMTVPWGPQKVIHSHTGREENKPVPRYKDNRSLQWLRTLKTKGTVMNSVCLWGYRSEDDWKSPPMPAALWGSNYRAQC